MIRRQWLDSLRAFASVSAPMQPGKWQVRKISTQRKPRGFWSRHENQIQQLNDISTKLRISSLDNWYAVSRNDVEKLGGASLLAHFDRSLSQTLQALYPDHEWRWWRFQGVPTTLRDEARSPRQVAEFFQFVHEAVLKLKSLDDWFHISSSELTASRVNWFVDNAFGGSLANALRVAFPEHQWLEWKFRTLNRDWWNEASNQRAFLDWASLQLFGGSNLESWYPIDAQKVKQLGGGPLLKLHSNSLIRALRTAYPEHTWEEWRFDSLPKNYWADWNNRRRYFDWLGQKLGITSTEQWKNVTRDTVYSNGGTAVLVRYYNSSVTDALADVYPDHVWRTWERSKAPQNVFHENGKRVSTG